MATREPIISVSGLRGIVGESLTPQVVQRYTAAFLAVLPDGPVVVTRDGRASGSELATIVQRAVNVSGRDCLEAGVAATPTTGILVREHGAAAGIQISASHNPAEYNGLKLFGADGRILSAATGAVVLEHYRSGHAPAPAAPGALHSVSDTTSAHAARIRQAVAVEPIRRRAFHVLLDANHGAGSVLGRALLQQLGCRVTLLGEIPDGQFAHPPEPTAKNLRGVLAEVAAANADVGFCQDPDADRLAILDEHGVYLGEEYTLAICVAHVLRQRRGAIVTNCSTSRMSEDLAQQYGVPFYRSAVGEANVAQVMRQHDALLGGEGNGGVMDPRVGLVRDSFVGMALVLEAMTHRDLPVSALAAELPSYAIHKSKIPLDRDRLQPALAAIEERFAGATPDRLDGLRLDWNDRWLLVRASNTEPIVRAIAEAPTAPQAQELCSEAAQVVARVTSSQPNDLAS